MNATLEVAAAAITTQFFLIVILVIGVLLRPSDFRLLGLILILALLTLGPLVFSIEFLELTGRVLGTELPGIKLSTALLIMFISNSLFLLPLLLYTGGSRGSPFSPVLFLLPIFAILLREPLFRIVVYLVLVIFTFSLGFSEAGSPYKILPLRTESRDKEFRKELLAHWAVAVASLVLATVIGFLTRPGS